MNRVENNTMNKMYSKWMYILMVFAMAMQSSLVAGLREDFARVDANAGSSPANRVMAVYNARCNLMIPGGGKAFKAYAEAKSLEGLTFEGFAPADAAAFAVAQYAHDGFCVYGIAERSGRFTRELVIVPGDGLAAKDAEVWNPQDGTAERPFVENGRVRITFAPRETLFLVWPEKAAVLPRRMPLLAGRDLIVDAASNGTRVAFSLGKVMPAGRLFFTCDCGKETALEINGKFIGGFTFGPRQMDVTRFVKPGDNVLRVLNATVKKPRLVWTAPAMGPYDLRCEYQTDALGVVKPRFFWKYAGERPKSFRIAVATSPDKLAQGDVYAGDTAEHLYVEPKLSLEPFTRYWWRVEGGGVAADGTFVSGIEKWRMPFFKPGWKYDTRQYWVARRKVELHGARSAILSLSTLGSHRLYVNGVPAGDGVAPNRSHVEDGIVLASTYDVTHLVKDGENEIAVYMCDGWLGTRLCKEKTSCLSVDGRIVTDKGVVAVDSSQPWTVSKSADRAFGPLGANGNGRRRGIERLHDVDIETDAGPGIVRKGPELSVSCDVSDRDYAVRRIRPVSIVPHKGGWRIDMGEAFTGFMKLKLKGKKGDVARMTASDTFVDDCTFGQVSEFVFSSGDGVFENRLNWQAGRFFHLTGCEKPEIDDVVGTVLCCAARRTGGFSGDADLEKIVELDANTFIATTQCGVTVDCPHRERLGYGEASLSSMWGDGMPLFDGAAYFYAYLLKWASSQRPDGSVPHVSPDGYGWGGTFWSSFPVNALAVYTRHYPDSRLKEKMRPVVEKWLDYLHGYVENGILQQYEKKHGDCLGDWLYPEIHELKNTRGDWGDTVEGMFFNNCTYAWAIRQALEMDGLVTDPARRTELKRRHAELVAAIDRTWYRNGVYVSEDARYQSIALVCGAAEAGGHREQTEKLMLDIVEGKGYVDGGSPTYTVILRAMCTSRRGRELMLRTFRRRSPPGFLFFADEGFNTIPEDWWYGRNSKGSMIHTCYTGPAGGIMRGLAGLNVDGGKVTVSPILSEALPNFESYTETLYGTLSVKVESRGDKRIVWIECPNGCEGVFDGESPRPLSPGLNRIEIMN